MVRHEIVALHIAESLGGAEFYPSCTQVKLGGNGSGTVQDTVKFPGAYSDKDPGILIDVRILSDLELVQLLIIALLIRHITSRDHMFSLDLLSPNSSLPLVLFPIPTVPLTTAPLLLPPPPPPLLLLPRSHATQCATRTVSSVVTAALCEASSPLTSNSTISFSLWILATG